RELMQVLDIDHVVDVHRVPPLNRPLAVSMAYYPRPRQSPGRNRNRGTRGWQNQKPAMVAANRGVGRAYSITPRCQL
ncbi:MAG: hypothetical protein AB7H71_02795, partial [Alphaproteobacteria bacterium]